MDEEDLAELAESRKLVDNTEEMDLTGGTMAEKGRLQDAENECVLCLIIITSFTDKR
jgi:G patch domain-containing protein 1